MTEELRRTALYDLHVKHGAKMVPFAGYEMPVQYPMGVMQEHLHTRGKAGLFDVSHMGQVILRGSSYEATAMALEKLIPMDVLGLPVGRQRYGLLTNEEGGLRDDLMFANREDHIYMVVNAGCKEADIAYMRQHLEPEVTLKELSNRALLALQGPLAQAVLAEHHPASASMAFMDVATLPLAGAECWVSRSGYTGEDGFEISVPESAVHDVANALLDNRDVALIGLGARDSLRLEAGLCLYGQDIDAQTSPVEASLGWAVQKVRRSGGARAGGFPGAARILAEFPQAIARKRVGLKPQGRAPMRHGVALYDSAEGGAALGEISSGGFAPSLNHPVAMGYVPVTHAAVGTLLYGEMRGKRLPIEVVDLPFVAANFKR